MKTELKDITRTLEAGRFAEAQKLIEDYQPKTSERAFVSYLRALTTFNLGHIEESFLSFQACLNRESPIEWWLNFGVVCRDSQRWASLQDVAHELSTRGITGYEASALISEAARRACRLHQAVEAFEEEHQRQPDDHRVTLGYANALRDARRYDDAVNVFKGLLSHSREPEMLWNMALSKLALGPSHLDALEVRFQRSTPPFLEYSPRTLPRLTDARQLSDARLLVVSEQGFGDTLQFCRYIGGLEEKCAALAWVVPKRLKTLLSLPFPEVELLNPDDVDEAKWDGWISLMSCGSLDLKEPEGPYLRAPKLHTQYQNYQGAVCINWAGSSTYVHDYWRSLSIKDFAPIYTGKLSSQLVSIQHGLSHEEQENLPSGVTHLGHCLDTGADGFCETAALIVASQALITTDTSVAHLAGGLGVKTHLILGPLADWRWEWNEESTPWYPSLRLHRWHSRDELPIVMAKVRDELGD